MDYGKSGNAKSGKGNPKFDAHSRHGTGAPARPAAKGDKAALLARMKASAEARKDKAK
jgi:hypothetical protein